MTKKIFPLRSPDNTPQMDEAIDRLDALNVPITRTSDHQLKVWDLNYWPNTGSISIDGQGKCQLRGLELFLDLVERAAHANGWRHHSRPTLRISPRA